MSRCLRSNLTEFFLNRFKSLLRFSLVFSLAQPAGFLTLASTKSNNPKPNIFKPDKVTQKKIRQVYLNMPLFFEKNEGQADPSVRYLARGYDYSLYLTPLQAIWVRPEKPISKKRNPLIALNEKMEVFRMKLKNANAKCRAEGVQELPGKSNYLVGNDSSKWRTNISQYSKVKFSEIYSNIDLIYYGGQNGLEYDFVVKPGGNPNDIRLKLTGANNIQTNENGNLEISLKREKLELKLPQIYQETRKGKVLVQGRFVMKEGNEVGFELKNYDSNEPLVIDPILAVAYSTYTGPTVLANTAGGMNDAVVDINGYMYLTGNEAIGFPTTSGSYEPNLNCPGGFEAIILKLNQTGTALIYATYLGGNGVNCSSTGDCIAADDLGNAYVGGQCGSNFPTTAGAFQTIWPGISSYIAKLNPTGTALVYSTFLGGSLPSNSFIEGPWAMALDSSNNVYVTGDTGLTNFPTTAGAFQPALATINGNNLFVTKVNSTGTALLYSTYLGGNYNDHPWGITVDAPGNAYVTGSTSSTNFPVTSGAFQTVNGSGGGPGGGVVTGFVTKLNPTGTALVYSTYLGGTTSDVGEGIAVDSSGNAFVTGQANSSNFPITAGAFQTTFTGLSDGFVTKLNSTGTALIYSTFLGGTGTTTGSGAQSVKIDGSGAAYIGGVTGCSDFPTTPGALQTTFGGGVDISTLSILNPSGTGLIYSTYWGGSPSELDGGSRIGLDSSGSIYLAGNTHASNFPTTAGVYQPTYNNISPGNANMFVSKFIYTTPTPGLSPTPTLSASSKSCDDTFYISKNIFNSTQESVSIHVSISCYPGNYSLKVYNTAGEFIKTIDSQTLTSPINTSYSWDGTNNSNAKVASGVYIFMLSEPINQRIAKVLLIR